MNITKDYNNTDLKNLKMRGRLLNYAAPVYDFIMQKVLFNFSDKRIVEQLNKLPVEKYFKILDVGCATGAILKIQIKRLDETGLAVGIDGALNMVKRANTNKSEARLNFICSDAAYLPFKNDYFDMAVNTMFLHHLPLDCKIKALTEMKRVLKKGGMILTADIDKPDNIAALAFIYLSSVVLFQKELKENADYGLHQLLNMADIKNNNTLLKYYGSVSIIESII